MMIVLERITTFAVALSMIAAGLPRGASASWSGGAATAAEAAKSGTTAERRVSEREVEAGQPVLAMGAFAAGYVDPDTTEFDFPEDDHKHLARDITVWVIASAFVAYFIIKVFIEKDDEPAPDNKPPGKTIP